ncbi:MAG: hypothetical protein ACP5Q4_10820, partial [Candidatus Caldatribacteriaceae bacterium]
LAIPFLLVGLGWGYLWGLFQSLQRRGRIVELISGLLLLALGIIMVWGKMESLLGALGVEGYLTPESLLLK